MNKSATRGNITRLENSDKGTATAEQLAKIAKLDPEMPLAGLTREQAAAMLEWLSEK